MWTTLVVAQLAVAVAVLPVAVYLSWQVVRMELAGPGFAAEQFVVGTVALSDDASAVDPDRDQATATRSHLASGIRAWRLRGHVLVGCAWFRGRPPHSSSTIGSRLRGMREPLEVSTLNVGLDLFDAYDAEILAGRGFNAGRSRRGQRRHRERHLRAEVSGTNRSPLGLRFRYSARERERRAPAGAASRIRSSESSATFRAFRQRRAWTASPPSIIRPRRETSIPSTCRCDSRRHSRRVRRSLSRDWR